MEMTADEELSAFLGRHITDHKREKIASVLDERTRHLTVLLEDIYQPHNASACLRSCDCLGVQDLHIVESCNDYLPNDDVAGGSSKWLTLHRYRRIEPAIEALKGRGYRLIATSPDKDGYDLTTLPVDKPLALLFGSEKTGLSSTAAASSDGNLRIPMYGFTGSFNISVALAIVVSRLVERLRECGLDWRLSEEEKKDLTLRFYRRTVTRRKVLEEQFREGKSGEPQTRERSPFP